MVYASSSNAYGAVEDALRTKLSEEIQLTDCARSKIITVNELPDLVDSKFKITCHRFVTAGGISERLSALISFEQFSLVLYQLVG